jgi:hypothetical protein
MRGDAQDEVEVVAVEGAHDEGEDYAEEGEKYGVDGHHFILAQRE